VAFPGPVREPAPERTDADHKEQALLGTLATWPALIVAYSGGVDSAYLAWAATRVLGRGALCITADSPSYPDRHRVLARQIAADFGFAHEIIHTGEMARPEYLANPANRCYYCKHELYTHLSGIARARGIPTIADGSNADDRGDYRPGRQAAKEFGVVSPLDAVGLAKAEIRELSHRAGLPTWDEPASACLSSRIPYFSEVTDAKLRMIEQAEAVLRELGFRVCRVRHHGDGEPMARLEIGRDEMARALESDVAEAIDSALRALGYRHVTLDLRGYRQGSLNDALRLRAV
jgi:pyridinium-3,5-biscarboxylic acid mononucleotide sulfurtransferase